jgi:hypothetical protein
MVIERRFVIMLEQKKLEQKKLAVEFPLEHKIGGDGLSPAHKFAITKPTTDEEGDGPSALTVFFLQ